MKQEKALLIAQLESIRARIEELNKQLIVTETIIACYEQDGRNKEVR